jgi:hypothetical protein
VNTGVTGSTIVLLCQTFVTSGEVIVQGGRQWFTRLRRAQQRQRGEAPGRPLGR